MTLAALRDIVALSPEGNFSRAAERCSVSQPPLGIAIARLGDALGVPLFGRDRGFVRPSPVGRRIVARAQRALR